MSGKSKTSRREPAAKKSVARRSAELKRMLAEPTRHARIEKELRRLYPDAACALHHSNAFELLVATILSAQCTDVRVNMVTPELRRRYPTIESLANTDQAELEQVIRSTGFYRNKAKSIRGAAKMIIERFDGRVPETMEELLELPGVARKTANVVLGNAFSKNVGMVVDTHVSRLSQRLGLTKQTDPVKIERELMGIYPRGDWAMLAHLLIFHGRQVCNARRPRCHECTLAPDCPKIGVSNPAPPEPPGPATSGGGA